MKAILSVLLLIPMVLFSQVEVGVNTIEDSTTNVYEEVDQEAYYSGGFSEMMKFLSNNIRYPSLAMENEEEGNVFVEFIVNANGSISDVKILRGVSKELDREAIRVVKRMPDWKPAEVDGKKVKSRYILPINFVLS